MEDELAIQLGDKEIEQFDLYMARKPRYHLERIHGDLPLGVQEV